MVFRAIIERYNELLEEPSRKRVRNSHLAGIFFGYSQASRIIFVGVVFWIGSELIRKYNENAEDIYTAIWVLFSAAMGAGVSMSNMPSISKAKESAVQIFRMVDEKSIVNS